MPLWYPDGRRRGVQRAVTNHEVGVFGAPTSLLVYCTDPGETVCDGVDDNCDTVVDEGLLEEDWLVEL